MRMSERENMLKLDILQSLTISQQAIAKIIASIADVTAMSESSARHVASNIQAIAKYQRMLANKIGLAQVKQMRSGSNGKPWLHDDVKISNHF